MHFTGIHIHDHVISHSHQKIAIGAHCHIIRDGISEVAVFKIEKCLHTITSLVIIFGIVRSPTWYFTFGIRLVRCLMDILLVGMISYICTVCSVVRVVLICPVIQLLFCVGFSRYFV